MEIPVLENEREAGMLSVAAQGLYTLFEARLAGEGSGLTRLWLRGGQGDCGSLGLLEPRGGERRLCRRMSRLELRRLPEEPWTALVLPAAERPSPAAIPGAGTEGPAPDPPCGVPEPESVWLRLSDGSLCDPERRLLALPWGGGELPAAARKITVNERAYLVFRT